MGLRGNGSGLDIGLARAGPSEGDVAADAAGEDGHVLGHKRDAGRAPRQDRRRGHRRDRSARPPVGDIVKSQESARTGSTCRRPKRRPRRRSRRAGHENWWAGQRGGVGPGGVGEMHIVKADVAFGRQRQRLGRIRSANVRYFRQSSSLSRSEAPAALGQFAPDFRERAEAARGKDRIEQELTRACRVSSLPTGTDCAPYQSTATIEPNAMAMAKPVSTERARIDLRAAGESHFHGIAETGLGRLSSVLKAWTVRVAPMASPAKVMGFGEAVLRLPRAACAPCDRSPTNGKTMRGMTARTRPESLGEVMKHHRAGADAQDGVAQRQATAVAPDRRLDLGGVGG